MILFVLVDFVLCLVDLVIVLFKSGRDSGGNARKSVFFAIGLVFRIS